MSSNYRLDISPSVVIQVLNKAIESKYKFINSIVFNPTADYQSAIMAGRSIDLGADSDRLLYKQIESFDPNKKKLLPLLSWSRGTLVKHTESGLGRVNRLRCTEIVPGYDTSIKQFLGQVDYQFQLYTTNMNDLERFELDWYLMQGLKSITTINVDLGKHLGNFIFPIIWDEELISIDWSLEGNYYKSLSGSAKISGPFLTVDSKKIDDKAEGQIFNINFTAVDCEGNLFGPQIEYKAESNQVGSDIVKVVTNDF